MTTPEKSKSEPCPFIENLADPMAKWVADEIAAGRDPMSAPDVVALAKATRIKGLMAWGKGKGYVDWGTRLECADAILGPVVKSKALKGDDEPEPDVADAMKSAKDWSG